MVYPRFDIMFSVVLVDDFKENDCTETVQSCNFRSLAQLRTCGVLYICYKHMAYNGLKFNTSLRRGFLYESLQLNTFLMLSLGTEDSVLLNFIKITFMCSIANLVLVSFRMSTFLKNHGASTASVSIIFRMTCINLSIALRPYRNRVCNDWSNHKHVKEDLIIKVEFVAPAKNLIMCRLSSKGLFPCVFDVLS